MEHRNETLKKISILSRKHGVTLDERETLKIFRMLENVPTIRCQKVDRIKQAIAAGKYFVPAEKIVSSMQKDSLEFEDL